MKHVLFALLLLYFCSVFAQKKLDIGLVVGGSSKLRFGIEQATEYPGVTKTHPFETFLNGGISVKYNLNEKHFLEADLMIHRMSITQKKIYNQPPDWMTWVTEKTRYDFIQIPITYNWTWNTKKIRPFIGVGIAPSYIISGQHFIFFKRSYRGTIESSNYQYELMNYRELKGIRHIKIPMVCEIGFRPLAHVVISFRSSLGIYIRPVGYDFARQNPFTSVDYRSQNNNMFSLLAKVYLFK